MKATIVAVLAAAALLAAPDADAAKPQGRELDLVWTSPALDTAKVGRIALLPAASFARDLRNEKLVEGMLARALVESGHRWVSSTTSRALLRSAAPDDSMLNGVRDEVLKNARLDSLSAMRVCAKLRTDAVLCVRVDRFDQVVLDATQSGKPSTTIQIRAALLGADGRQLWTVSGSETGEGPYQSPSSDPYRTPGGGVNANPTVTAIGPPSYEEVLTRLFDRWAPRFPKAPAGAPE